MYPYQNMNMLPQQQILQANGKASIDSIRLAPNSSVLIADQTAPIIWKCVSDSLGNVTATPFDITPHKDEAQIEKESIIARLDRLEKQYESFISRATKPTNAAVESYVPKNTENAKPNGVSSNATFAKPQG